VPDAADRDGRENPRAGRQDPASGDANPRAPLELDPHAADDPEGSPALPATSLGAAAGPREVELPAEAAGDGYADI